MAWYAVFERATGRLESLGTVLAEEIPAEFDVIELPGAPDDSEMWDEPSRRFIPRPPKVIVDLLNSPLLATLNPVQRRLVEKIVEEGRFARG
jgi:hypothetical protein